MFELLYVQYSKVAKCIKSSDKVAKCIKSSEKYQKVTFDFKN